MVGLLQKRRNSSADALALNFSCNNTSNIIGFSMALFLSRFNLFLPCHIEAWINVWHVADTILKFIFSWWRHQMIKWKHFLCHLPFVQGIHQSLVNSLHKGQWGGALMFSLTCAWINGWVNNHEAGYLGCHRAHYDATVMLIEKFCISIEISLKFASGGLLTISLGNGLEMKRTYHYLNQCWLKSMMPYGITQPQWFYKMAAIPQLLTTKASSQVKLW